jgi:fatty-acyl-CoA synthase
MDSLIASRLSVTDLVRQRARAQPAAPALTDGVSCFSYAELDARCARLALGLRGLGLRCGDRVAICSENRIEYIELELAAARLGIIVACLNWRLADAEMLHCIRLVAPSLVVVSPRYAAMLARLDHGEPRVVHLGDEFDRLRESATEVDADETVDPEAGLVILYTSGTTGLPKGALISHRAMVARAMVFSSDYGIGSREGYVAWSPLFHMAATDFALATLMLGGKVTVHDGLQVDRLCELLASEPIGWLVAMPGMIESLIDGLKRLGRPALSLRLVGAMADLVPPHQIAELSGLIGAPYLNSFGATETGLPPASGALLAPGLLPTRLSKRISGLCAVRLVDGDDREVPLETPGEMTMRGPTLFSGYWTAEGLDQRDFAGGWFHMGDMFVRHADGGLDFVDRLKYLIKSGGENIYPAEVERALMSHPAVRDAAVVRKRDAHWGEVPVAFVALHGDAVDGPALLQWCRDRLAAYKLPKEIRFVDEQTLPRSSTGKIQRHEIERLWL